MGICPSLQKPRDEGSIRSSAPYFQRRPGAPTIPILHSGDSLDYSSVDSEFRSRSLRTGVRTRGQQIPLDCFDTVVEFISSSSTFFSLIRTCRSIHWYLTSESPESSRNITFVLLNYERLEQVERLSLRDRDSSPRNSAFRVVIPWVIRLRIPGEYQVGGDFSILRLFVNLRCLIVRCQEKWSDRCLRWIPVRELEELEVRGNATSLSPSLIPRRDTKLSRSLHRASSRKVGSSHRQEPRLAWDRLRCLRILELEAVKGGVLFARTSGLQELCVTSCPGVTGNSLSMLDHLVHLKLKRCPQMTDVSLQAGLANLVYLRSLSLHQCQEVSSALFSSLPADIVGSLIRVTIDRCPRIDDSALSRLQSCEELTLRGGGDSLTGETLTQLSRLRVLTVRQLFRLTDDQVTLILPQLRSVHVIDCWNITSQAFYCSKSLSLLEELTLDCCSIDDELLPCLEPAPLRRLTLRYCGNVRGTSIPKTPQLASIQCLRLECCENLEDDFFLLTPAVEQLEVFHCGKVSGTSWLTLRHLRTVEVAGCVLGSSERAQRCGISTTMQEGGRRLGSRAVLPFALAPTFVQFRENEPEHAHQEPLYQKAGLKLDSLEVIEIEAVPERKEPRVVMSGSELVSELRQKGVVVVERPRFEFKEIEISSSLSLIKKME